MASHRTYLLTLGAGLAVCFAVQTAAIRLTGGKTVKSESNFFSSLARLQTASVSQPQVILSGSSMTGRLPDRLRGFPGTANMGCDGGSAMEVLEAMDRGDLPVAPLIIVEANTLFRAVRPPGKELPPGLLEKAVQSAAFDLGARVPQVSAAGRPSSILYSLLLERKLGQAEGATATALASTTSPGPASASPPAAPWTQEEEEFLQNAVSLATRLQQRGSRLVLVMLPGLVPEGAHRHIAEEFGRRAGLDFWDLAAGAGKDAIRLTDGVHMAPASAAAVMKTLMDTLHP